MVITAAVTLAGDPLGYSIGWPMTVLPVDNSMSTAAAGSRATDNPHTKQISPKAAMAVDPAAIRENDAIDWFPEDLKK